MRIGKLKLKGNLLLAPLANVSNLAFRMMCRKYGASLTYSEMISSDALIYQNKKTIGRGLTCKDEKPFGIQIFGNSPQTMAEAALIIEKMHSPEIIDVNFGCPAPIITRAGCGSALLKSPEDVYNIIDRLTDTLSTPVSAKIRVLEDMEKTLEVARAVEDAGACAITVHGRTQTQKYLGTSNLEYARKIKAELSIPVIANGDIKDELSAQHALEYTQCDGLMIGRGAMGDPHIFSRISHYLETGEFLETDTHLQRVKDFLEYISLLNRYDILSFANLRTQSHYFTRGIHSGRHIRKSISRADNVEALVESLMVLVDGRENTTGYGNIYQKEMPYGIV